MGPTLSAYIPVLLCTIGIAIGQLLFKRAALDWKQHVSLQAFALSPVLWSALIVYSLTTVLWVYALRQIDLSRAYTIMALNFIFVPIGAWYFFGETTTPSYWIGVALIILGIVVCTK